MNSLSSVPHRQWYLLMTITAMLLLWSVSLNGQLAAPESFGYNSLPVTGERNLLVILLDYSDHRFEGHHTKSYYERRFFGSRETSNVPNLMGKGGYFYHSSNGSFHFKNAGFIGPFCHIDDPATAINESTYLCATGRAEECNDISEGQHLKVAVQLAAQHGYDFAQFDENTDGVVNPEELTILVIDANQRSNGGGGGKVRGVNVQVSGIRYIGGVSSTGEGANNSVIIHEVSHTLGTGEAYGAWGNNYVTNANYSVMSSYKPRYDGVHAVEMDPYHRMRLGWVKPKVIDITQSDKSLSVLATELIQKDGYNQLYLFYDPEKGTKEYFLIENRIKDWINNSDENLLRLESWWSRSRGDNFATTKAEWRSFIGDQKGPDYHHYRHEGFIFRESVFIDPVNGIEIELVPLYSWYSEPWGDNFATTDPEWNQNTSHSGYRFIRIEGYVFDPNDEKPIGTVPLYSWWNSERKDNFITTDPEWSGEVGDVKMGYQLSRIEGYLYNFPFSNNDGDSWTQGKEMMPDEGIGIWHLLLDPMSYNMRKIPAAKVIPISGNKLPLNIWYSPDREEHITTTKRGWQWNTDLVPDASYRLRSIDGYIKPYSSQPTNSEVPLYSWWSESRKDNFTTTRPAWAGQIGDERDGYRLYRIEGYIRSSPRENYTALYNWWSESRKDNFLTTQWSGEIGDTREGYRLFRVEGYIEQMSYHNDDGMLIIPPVGKRGLPSGLPPYGLWDNSDEIRLIKWFDETIAFNLKVVSKPAEKPWAEVILNPTTTTSVDQHAESNPSEKYFKVFPNPFFKENGHSLFAESLSPHLTDYSLKIYDRLGRMIYQTGKSKFIGQNDIQKILPDGTVFSTPGIYFVVFQREDLVFTQPLMVR